MLGAVDLTESQVSLSLEKFWAHFVLWFRHFMVSSSWSHQSQAQLGATSWPFWVSGWLLELVISAASWRFGLRLQVSWKANWFGQTIWWTHSRLEDVQENPRGLQTLGLHESLSRGHSNTVGQENFAGLVISTDFQWLWHFFFQLWPRTEDFEFWVYLHKLNFRAPAEKNLESPRLCGAAIQSWFASTGSDA